MACPLVPCGGDLIDESVERHASSGLVEYRSRVPCSSGSVGRRGVASGFGFLPGSMELDTCAQADNGGRSMPTRRNPKIRSRVQPNRTSVNCHSEWVFQVVAARNRPIPGRLGLALPALKQTRWTAQSSSTGQRTTGWTLPPALRRAVPST